MQNYLNINGDSGVIGYDVGGDFIRVSFSTGSRYVYTYSSAGAAYVEQMKSLAGAGAGLNAFINKYARNLYERKE